MGRTERTETSGEQLPPGTDIADEMLLSDAIGERCARDNGDDASESGRQERIRAEAHRRYQARGARDGRDVEDWLAAEAAIDAEEGRLESRRPG